MHRTLDGELSFGRSALVARSPDRGFERLRKLLHAGSAGGGGTVTVLMGTAPDSLDPGLGATTPVLRGHLAHLHRSRHLCPRLRRSGDQTDPGPGRKPADRLHGRQDLHVHAAQRPRLLQRHARQGLGLHLHDRACDQARLGRQELPHRKHRRRRSVRQGQGLLDLRHPDRRRDRHDHDQTRCPLRPVPECARLPRGRPRAERHTDEKPHQQPAPGVGPYEIESVVPNKSFSLVRNPHFSKLHDPRRTRRPRGREREDRLQQPERGRAGARQQRRRVRLQRHDPPDAALPGRKPGLRALRKGADRLGRVLLPERQSPSPSTTRSCARRSTTRSTGAPCSAWTAGCSIRRASSCRSGCPAIRPRPCPYGEPNAEPNLAKAKELVRQSGLRRHVRHRVGWLARPAQGIRRLLRERAERDRASKRPRRSSPTPSTTQRSATSRQAPNRLAVIQPGLPQPDRLLPAARREIDPARPKTTTLSQVNDPHIQSELASLGPVPSSQLDSVLGRWQALDEYTAQKAYMAAVRLRRGAEVLLRPDRLRRGDIPPGLRQRLEQPAAEMSRSAR